MSKLKTNLILILFFALTTNVFAMEQEEKDTYALNVGQKAAKRRALIQQHLGEYSTEHLKKAGLCKGQTVVDLGCGTGDMIEELAKGVGDSGHVIAVDVSWDQLTVAKQKVEALGLTNVSFVRSDAQSLEDFPVNTVDFVYMRLVLSHINNPQAVIGRAKHLLKRDGVIACQDIIKSTMYEPYENAAYTEEEQEVIHGYRGLVKAMGKFLGNDYDLAARLSELYEQEGLSVVENYSRKPVINGAQLKENFILESEEWGDKVIQASLLTQDTLGNWRRIISAMSEDKRFYLASYTYVVARKESD